MYALARDVTSDCRNIPKGTRVSDVYEMPDGSISGLAHIWGQRIKLQLVRADLVSR
jgi:hypothetical protein